MELPSDETTFVLLGRFESAIELADLPVVLLDVVNREFDGGHQHRRYQIEGNPHPEPIGRDTRIRIDRPRDEVARACRDAEGAHHKRGDDQEQERRTAAEEDDRQDDRRDHGGSGAERKTGAHQGRKATAI